MGAMNNQLGAYIQHRWYNPTAPRQTAADVMPYAAALYGLGDVTSSACGPAFPDGSIPNVLADTTVLPVGSGIDVWASVRGMARPQVYRFKVTYRPTTVGKLRWITARQLTRARKRWTTLCATRANPTYVIPVTGYDIDEDGCSTRPADRERCPDRTAGLGLFSTVIGEAGEWIDFVKIGVWVVGGLAAGYFAGFLYRELRTENPRRRRRNRKRRNLGNQVIVTRVGKRFRLAFSRLPGRTFGPFSMAEAIKDLRVSALLSPADARDLVLDAAAKGRASRPVNA